MNTMREAGLFPYQQTAARFLAEKKRALLADGMRVGKTGAAIGAADLAGAEDILWITKGAARRSHASAWRRFQAIKRDIVVAESGDVTLPFDGVTITSYDLAVGPLFDRLRRRRFDVIVIDECHRAKTKGTKRTAGVYGEKCDGDGGLVELADNIWPMSGTPAPNHYGELWTMMRAVMPERILGKGGSPMARTTFEAKFCRFQNNGFGARIVGSKNHKELRERLGPRMLRRTLKDVRPDQPDLMFDILPLDAAGPRLAELQACERESLLQDVADRLRNATDDEADAIFERVDATLKLRLRRLTGLAKVAPMVDWVVEQFEDGLEKLVLFAHHREVIDGLYNLLLDKKLRPVRIYGGMSPGAVAAAQSEFQDGPAQVAIGQIEAAGEAIDLSAADQLVLVEYAYVPGPNNQAAHRVVNVTKAVSTLARYAVLSGSIDERIGKIAMNKAAELAKLFG